MEHHFADLVALRTPEGVRVKRRDTLVQWISLSATEEPIKVKFRRGTHMIIVVSNETEHRVTFQVEGIDKDVELSAGVTRLYIIDGENIHRI